jgi:chromosome segregation ATPase
MMCKTIKKGVVGAGLGALVLGVLFGTSAPHYVRTAVHKVRSNAQDRVPIEWKIDEAKQQVAALVPAIHENIEVLARAEVEVDQLREEILVTKANLDLQGREMLALKDAMDNGRTQLTGGISYTGEEIRTDLERRLDQYRRGKEILDSKEETLKVKQGKVEAVRKVLAEMATQKKALETKIEGIESRLHQIEATQATNEYSFDTTPLSQAKATVTELEKQLEVLARQAEYEGQYVEKGVTVTVEPDRDVLKEIEAEFERSSEAAGKSL